MNKYKQEIINKNQGFIFSAADIFSNEIYWKMNISNPDHKKEFYDFWRTILNNVAVIYMTPGWEKSSGAKDEHNTAKKLGIKIIYL